LTGEAVVRAHPLRAHPYMANSATGLKAEMLAATGAQSIEELFAQIPREQRIRRPLDLPSQMASESELRRHLIEMLARSRNCADELSFLGSGCYGHYVPAICDEIVSRYELRTSVWGTPSSDEGRFQAWFEFASELGELLDLDFVGLPVYSAGCAAGHALRAASGDPHLLRTSRPSRASRSRHGPL
jgi:glycine dehydrogenase subunit 1